MQLRLYEIPHEAEKLELALEESAGELTHEIEEALKAFDLRSRESLDHASAILKRFSYGIDALKMEEERMRARRKGLEAAQERLREMMLPGLMTLGGKIKTDRFTVYTQTRNHVEYQLIDGHQVTELPYQYLRFKDPEMDKTALNEAFKAGEPLPEILRAVTEERVSVVVR